MIPVVVSLAVIHYVQYHRLTKGCHHTRQHFVHYVFKIIETLTNVFLHFSWKGKRGNISPGGELFSVTHFYIFCSEEMYNYYPKFCYGT